MNRKELLETSLKNWVRIDAGDRVRCLAHLGETVPPDLLASWQEGIECGDVTVGESDTYFHFGTGMSVRNVLRDVLPDSMLPPVEYEGGSLCQNWDDYYLGALHEFVTGRCTPWP